MHKREEDIFYEALRARDHRFDGKFFVGVKTTGIYCRPICPAKPKRQNVEFFPDHFAAERAGYRPCQRCRPECAPQSPAWIGKSAVVRRAIKALHQPHSLELDVEGFASLFGVSARHLRRLFIEEIGKTPNQLFLDARLNLARKLLVETSLPATEVAFASGFNSIRRFNAAFRERFKMSPTGIRRKEPEDRSGLKISLPYRPPYAFDGLLRFYESHRVGDLEWFQDHKMHRIVELDGKVGQVSIANDAERSRLLLEIDFPDTSMIHTIVSRVRVVFDLDSDPVLIANGLACDPLTRKLLKKHPGIRVPPGWEGFEVAVSTILGQVVSVERGRALVHDLIELLGKDSGFVRQGRRIKLFPPPQQIASLGLSDLDSLRTTTARKRTLIEFSKAVAQKRISLEPTQDVDAFMSGVRSIPGVGPWSASYMALKVLRHTDAFPETDLILARALELHPRENVERMSPWRGYAAALYWREYAEILTQRKTKRRAK